MAAVIAGDGTDWYRITTNTPTIDAITMMAWAYWSGDVGSDNVLFGFGENSSTSQDQYEIGIEATGDICQLYADGAEFQDGAGLSSGVWTHFCIVQQGTGAGDFLGYIDGALRVTGNGDTSITGVGLVLWGDTVGTANSPWTGNIAACKLWGRVLTQEEIAREMWYTRAFSRRNLHTEMPLWDTGTGVASSINLAGGSTYATNGAPAYTPGPPIALAPYRKRFPFVKTVEGGGTNQNVSCTDGIVLGDSSARQTAFAASATDGIAAGESSPALGTFIAQAADAILGGDTVTAEAAMLSAIQDGLVLADTSTGARLFLVSGTDGVVFADTATGEVLQISAALDGVTLGDAAVSTLDAVASLLEGLLAGDTATATATMLSATAEGFTLGDTADAAWATTATATDAMTLGDAAAGDTLGVVHHVYSSPVTYRPRSARAQYRTPSGAARYRPLSPPLGGSTA